MSLPGRILVIVNPASGGGRARRVQPHVADLLRKHGVQADFAESQSSENIQRRAAQAAAAGYTTVAALGGDGAFHHAVNGAFGTGVDFAFFPAGNGNDIARGLGIPLDTLAAAAHFLRGRPRAVDVLQARFADGGKHLYIAAGGMGLDAEAARLVSGRFRALPGVTRYVAAALWALREFQPMEVEAQVDGENWSGPVLLAAIANGPCYGAGLYIAPAAQMDDGLLDVTLVGPLPLLRILEAISILLTTGDLRWPEIHRFRARKISLRAKGAAPAFFHGDGEVLGQAPVEIEVLPAALRVIY